MGKDIQFKNCGGGGYDYPGGDDGDDNCDVIRSIAIMVMIL
jgi:hypothetical protein